MSYVKEASGGDGWSSWSVKREGMYDMRIRVTSSSEQVKGETPSGWEPKVIADELLRDPIGRHAVDRAISVSASYGARMAR